MGLTVGKYSFPEDMLKDRLKLLALISIAVRRLGISQKEWDEAVQEAQQELLKADPDLRVAPKEQAPKEAVRSGK